MTDDSAQIRPPQVKAPDFVIGIDIVTRIVAWLLIQGLMI